MLKKLLGGMILLLTVIGCTVMEKKETFATCRVVDTVATLYIVHHGGTEVNPIMKSVINAGVPFFIALQIAVVALAYNYWPQLNATEKEVINTISCVPAVYNLGQL